MRAACVAVVIGTRPEAIKLAPLVLALRRQPGLVPLVVTTGQHTEVVDELLGIFGITAAADLAVATAGTDLDGIAAAVLTRFAGLLRAQRPTAVVVQGDTTSAFGAALAAFYQGIPVAHLEAGLRSDDRLAPFPEEVHRRATALLADLHFAPTPREAAHLVAEGVNPAAVWTTGNTVIDALHMIRGCRAPYRDSRLKWLEARRRSGGADAAGRILLVTAHRRESWGAPLDRIVLAVGTLGLERPDITVVVSTHPNPVVRKAFAPLSALDNVLLIEPEPYGSFVRLLDLADVILTDSGGIQEEAPSLGTPVLVLRDVTERTVGLEAGVARVIGTDTDRIVAETGRLLDDRAALAAMTNVADLYGDGAAADRCASALATYLTSGARPRV
jgi:UDP-N-acetylglucosamine 2-epimerase (non-hydrolysing)